MKTIRLSADLDTQLEVAKKFIAIDTETTGLKPGTNRLIEIGAVVFENCVPTRTFSTLINPGEDFPNIAVEVNHITPDMLANAPSEAEALSALVDFLSDALIGETIVVGHNVNFDLEFLIRAFERFGYTDFSFRYVDTWELAKKRVRNLINYKQSSLLDFFGIENKSAHRATSDAEACGQLLVKLLELPENGITAYREKPAANQDKEPQEGLLF